MINNAAVNMRIYIYFRGLWLHMRIYIYFGVCVHENLHIFWGFVFSFPLGNSQVWKC